VHIEESESGAPPDDSLVMERRMIRLLVPYLFRSAPVPPPPNNSGAVRMMPPPGANPPPLPPRAQPVPPQQVMDPAPTIRTVGLALVLTYVSEQLRDFFLGGFGIDLEARYRHRDIWGMTEPQMEALSRERQAEFERQADEALEQEAERQGISTEELFRQQMQRAAERCPHGCLTAP